MFNFSVVLLLLLNVLLFSSCLTCCSLLVGPVVRLLLFDLLLSSCWTYCSTPLVRLVTILFLLDLSFSSFYSTYYFIPLVQHVVLLILFDLLFIYLSVMLMNLIFLTPFVQCYCSCPSYFRLILFHPLLLVWVLQYPLTRPNSNSLGQTWKVIFFFQSLFVDEFFNYPCFCKRWLILCLFVVHI